MNSHTKSQLDQLLERLGILDERVLRWKATRELTFVENFPPNYDDGNEADDEFTELDRIELWENYLSDHGFSPECLASPDNPERVCLLYQRFCDERDYRGRRRRTSL